MAEIAPPQKADTTGYISPEHKKTYTTAAGILGTLFFIAQFVFPVVIMLVAMPSMIFSGAMTVREAHPSRGALWNGKLWYPEAEIGLPETKQRPPQLTALSFSQQQGPQRIADIPVENPWLLAAPDRIWVIGGKGVAYYKDGEFFIYPGVKTLGDISPPFFYKDLPALVESRPDGLFLMVFRGNAWQEELSFQFMRGPKFCISDLQVIPQEGSFHVFLKYGGSLYYREGLNYGEKKEEDAWQAIAPDVSNWHALLLGNTPSVFVVNAGNGSGTITGYKKNGVRWEPFFTRQGFIVTGLGAYELQGKDGAAMLTQGFPGSLNLITINDGKVAGTVRHGSAFPFPKNFMLMLLSMQGLTFCLPLLLAVILSGLMRKHRVVSFQAGTDTLPYASLARRAFAQVIDAFIALAPLLSAGVWTMGSLFNEEAPFFTASGFFPMLALMLGGLLWMLLCLLVFSIMEGLRGVTPGKWVFGIRALGTDLQYCGFWRALVRNLLRFVDGFFNYLVGILLVAFTEHWQRVGDLAARTVVLDVRNREAPGKKQGPPEI